MAKAKSEAVDVAGFYESETKQSTEEGRSGGRRARNVAAGTKDNRDTIQGAGSTKVRE